MNAEQLMLQDIQSRQQIVEDIHTNFFVEAGAGSGKTTILVKRMVAMVEQGLDVSKICAITFTKAAAGEFYDRFQKALIERSTAPTVEDFQPKAGELGNPTDLTRERCLTALNNIDLCFMGTIDAFCNMILSEHPAKAGIPSDSAVLQEDEDMPVYYRKAYSQIQQGHYGSDLQQLCKKFCAFHSNPDSLFQSAMATMMQTRNCQHIFDAPPDTDMDALLQDEKARLMSVLKTLQTHPELLYTKHKDSRDGWDALQKNRLLLNSSWQDNAHQMMYLLKAIGGIRLISETDLSIFGSAGEGMFQPHHIKTTVSWYQFSDDSIAPIINRLQNLRYSVTMEFLTAACAQIAQQLRKDGKLTFFDYLLYLRDMLREDAANGGSLIRHIYERHQYFLIDEFQDTNPMQAEVFFYLTAENPKENWKECIPRPGSLFIVGDPKQSIYRFRYADVSAFLRIKEMFDGKVGQVVYLTRNFRSTHKLRSWFNRTFSELLPDTTPLQSRFEPIPLEDAPAPDNTFGGVYSYDVRSGAKAAPEELDHNKVAKIIRRIVNNPAYTIQPRGGAPRMLSYQDIMLITPTKSNIGNFLQTFVENAIPFHVEGEVLFDQCPSLVAVSRIFSAVADPRSRQYLFGALTCQRFGFDLNALHRLKNEGYDFSLFAEHPSHEPVTAAMDTLKALVSRSRQLSAVALFSVILDELEIFRYVSTKNLQYLYFAQELLRSAESSGEFATMAQAAAYLETLISNASGTERAISLTQNEDRIHIANLHKVKGLEAPVIILASPSKKTKKPVIRVEQQDPQPLCWIFSFVRNHRPILSCEGYDDARDMETACLEAEEKRLLYVAATRAQKALIVANALKSDGTPSDSNPWKFFVDRSEADFFESLPVGEIAPLPEKEAVRAAALYEDAAPILPNPESENPSYALCRPSQIKLKGKTSEDGETEPLRTRTNAALTGTLVHSLMESLVSSRNQVPLSALVEELASEYEADDETYTKLLTKVGTTIQNGGFPQENGAPVDILSTLLSADEVYCEVPFCRKDGNAIWHGIMDVVYRLGEQWFILDYKTNADAHALDFKYQEQLTAYAEAFRELTGHTAIPLIYHIDV